MANIYSLEGKGLSLRSFSDNFLAAVWAKKLGLLKGNPDSVQRAHFGEIEVRLCPWRANRPLPPLNPKANIMEPHRSCTFDKPEVVSREGVAAAEITGRVYQLLINVNPIDHRHFLLSRSATTPDLEQIIHSSRDINDLIELHRLFPAEYSFLFNSNAGGETNSGASQNHFHVHVFSFGDALKFKDFSPLAALRSAAGEAPGWSASHRILEDRNASRLAENIFRYARVIQQANNAYNLAFFRYPDGRERVVVIPRTLAGPVTPFLGRTPVDRFGGDAHTGSICSFSDQETFRLMQQQPGLAEQVLHQQLRETTVKPAALAAFDAEAESCAT